MSTQQLKQKGFTIIEVVLVLAIAALIFLMVFIALPALQRGQRDEARKTVLGKVATAVTNYQSNKRGQQPANGAALAGYVDGTAQGADTIIDNNYTVRVTNFQANGVGAASETTVHVMRQAKCNSTGDAAVSTGASIRNAAVLMRMENGGSILCMEV